MKSSDTKGGALLYIIVLMVLFGALAAALLPFVTTRIDNRLTTVGTYQARLSVEAGQRLAEQAHCTNAWDGAEPLQFNLPTGTLTATKMGNTFNVLATAYQGTAMQASAQESFGFVCDLTEPPPPPPVNQVVTATWGGANSLNISGGGNISGNLFAFAVATGSNTVVDGSVISETTVSLASGTQVTGSICATGNVELASSNSFVGGDIHTQGNVVLQSGTTVNQSVFAGGNVELRSSNSRVEGDLHSQGDVTLGSGTRVTGNIFAAGNVTLSSSNAQVGGSIHAGGSVILNQSNISGSIFANGTITLNNSSTVSGSVTSVSDIIRGSGGASTIGGPVQAGGTRNDFAPSQINLNVQTPTQPSPPVSCPSLPDPPAFQVFTPGNSAAQDMTLAQNSTVTLAHGIYRNITINGGSTLTLRSGNGRFPGEPGVYVFNNFSAANWGQTIRYDFSPGGTITILIAGNMEYPFLTSQASQDGITFTELSRGFSPGLSEAQARDFARGIYWEVHGTVNSGSSARVLGTIYAGGSVSFGSSFTAAGAVLSRTSVTFGSNPEIRFQLADFAANNW